MNATTRIIVAGAAIGLLAIGVAGGYWWGHRHASSATAVGPRQDDEREVLYWYDPMSPDQHFDRPGKSPFMDMQLLPKYADEAPNSGIRIDSGVQQNVGIRTALVEVGTLAPLLRVPATLTWDLRRESVVSAPVSAIVSRVYARAPFATVHSGQPLAALLAPEWGGAAAEADALRQAGSEAGRELRDAARRRLRVLGVPAGTGRNGSATLTSPRTGVISEVLVSEGQSVMPGTPLFRVNGTETLWLEAAIPQAGSGGIGPGTKVEATVNAIPGEVFVGEVEALLPQIDAASRTQRARIVLRNEGGKLVPGMFAELTLRGAESAAVPLVPIEALIATGTDSRVIVLGPDGRLQPVRVRIGRSSGGRAEVLAGLKGGERVVTSGQFLIDSEASLSGALQRLDELPGGQESSSSPSFPRKREPFPRTDVRSSMDVLGSDVKRAVRSETTQETGETQAKGAKGAKGPGEATPMDPRLRGNDGQHEHTQHAVPQRCPVSYWYDPMVPDKHFDQPGKSPFMDMMLVPKFAPEADPACTVRDVEAAPAPMQDQERHP